METQEKDLQAQVAALYAMLRKAPYRGALTNVALKAEVSHQWAVKVLSGKVPTENDAVIKIYIAALAVKKDYDQSISEKQKLHHALSQRIAQAIPT